MSTAYFYIGKFNYVQKTCINGTVLHSVVVTYNLNCIPDSLMKLSHDEVEEEELNCQTHIAFSHLF